MMNSYDVKLRKVIEVVKEPILAVLTALLISSFIISHTRVPTESMKYTIYPGDHLIVNRIPYYYRNPERGEIVVFTYQEDHLIKRVIGLPGDVIDIINNKVYVNGEAIEESPYLEEGVKTYLYSGSAIDFPYEVPTDYYFMMGDNRVNSKDSRVFGPIPRTDIIAKAGFRIFPFKRIGIVE